MLYSLAYPPPSDSSASRISRPQWIAVALATLLGLLPTLFFPLGPDESIYFVGGEKIFYQSAIHYRDIVDVKPPPIFYIYAAAIGIFGDHEQSIRMLDLLLQGATCVSLIMLVRKVTADDGAAALGAIIYAVLYSSLGYQATAQPESYAGLLLIGTVRLLLIRPSILRSMAAGMMIGVLALIKFTFLLLFPIVPLTSIVILRAQRGRETLAAALGTLAIVALLPLYLIMFDAVDDYLLLQEYLRGYVELAWTSPFEAVKRTVTGIGSLAGDVYSLALLTPTIVGIMLTFAPDGAAQSDGGNRRELLQTFTLVLTLLLGSVIIEGRYFSYHISRLYLPGALLAAFGWMALRRMESQARPGYRILMSSVIIPGMLIFSPLTRFVWYTTPAVLLLARGESAYDAHYSRCSDGSSRTRQQEAAGFLLARMNPADELFAAAWHSSEIYRFAGYIPTVRLYAPAVPMKADYAPEHWRREIRDVLMNRVPRFIVIELDDTQPDLSGNDRTSLEAIRRLPDVAWLLDHRYRCKFDNGSYQIHVRQDGAP